MSEQPTRQRTARPSRRSSARRVAMQALYQWQMTAQPVGEIERLFREDAQKIRADMEYFHDLLQGVADQSDALDALLVPVLDRPIAQIDPVERAILRLGAYELRDRLEVPYRVIINEGVELAHAFGAEQGHRYVNGVLDAIAQSTRPHETRETAEKPRPAVQEPGEKT